MGGEETRAQNQVKLNPLLINKEKRHSIKDLRSNEENRPVTYVFRNVFAVNNSLIGPYEREKCFKFIIFIC